MPRVAKKTHARSKKSTISGRGTYYKKDRASGAMVPVKKKAIRRKMDAKGQGGYSNVWGAGGTALGTALGALVGQPAIGGLIGGLGGAAIQHFIGRGDYEVVNNCFLKNGQMCEPIINPHQSGGDVFRRSEYLTDVVSSSTPGAFSNRNYSVNPGLEGTFTALSQIAANYDEYSIEGMYFEFRSMSGDALNSTNTALGQVIMAAQYNASAPDFANKQAMENYEGGVSCRPSGSMRYFVECAPKRSVLETLYIRAGGVPAGQDQRLYDLCDFQIATNGFQAASVNVGELWVTYQVCLRKPKLYSCLGLYHSYMGMGAESYSAAFPFGDNGANYTVTSNNIPGLTHTGTAITFDAPTMPQLYKLILIWVGTVGAVIVAPTITLSNGLQVADQIQVPVNVTNTASFTININMTYLPSANINYGKPTITAGVGATLPSGTAYWRGYIDQLPNTLQGI